MNEMIKTQKSIFWHGPGKLSIEENSIPDHKMDNIVKN